MRRSPCRLPARADRSWPENVRHSSTITPEPSPARRRQAVVLARMGRRPPAIRPRSQPVPGQPAEDRVDGAFGHDEVGQLLQVPDNLEAVARARARGPAGWRAPARLAAVCSVQESVEDRHGRSLVSHDTLRHNASDDPGPPECQRSAAPAVLNHPASGAGARASWMADRSEPDAGIGAEHLARLLVAHRRVALRPQADHNPRRRRVSAQPLDERIAAASASRPARGRRRRTR